ncbi:hypothetical protein [Lewinella sp. JB7]|uniref:hypothetical protein n=1 Tax=Lewinella sp. JB7 TaxID=2962887 RepID=UPI0020C95B17|nr:hypothetical protein [Lewinella sp. JB7]MCP9236552.1 hypothetical protein [Lewinella sp. JB7]
MQPLSFEETTTIEGGIPWLVVLGVGIIVAGFIDGCNNSRYETTAKEEEPITPVIPEC